MKKKIIIISLTLLITTVIAGSSMAWQLHNTEESVNEFKMGTVKVEVVEKEFTDIKDVTETTYDKKVQAKSLGTKETYVRVRLIPQWSEPSLPTSNVELNISRNGDWTKRETDGYYYFKYYLTENQLTSLLLESISFKDLGPEYEGADFTLKVVTEGVQTTNGAWKDVWGLTNLPFTPDRPWSP